MVRYSGVHSSFHIFSILSLNFKNSFFYVTVGIILTIVFNLAVIFSTILTVIFLSISAGIAFPSLRKVIASLEIVQIGHP